MNHESTDPHQNEELLQSVTERETERFGNKRYEYPAPIDDTELGGNTTPEIPPSLPDGKSKAFYVEGGKMLVDENIARRQIRANQARTDAGLPPIDIKE